jgi:hypothetical protein
MYNVTILLLFLRFIMRTILMILTISLFGCNHSTKVDSYWEGQKDNFKYRNKTYFFISEEIQHDLAAFKKVKLQVDRWIDSVYLYSWQERDPSKNEFTVIGLEDESGPALFYVIMDKKDSLLSSIQLAGINNEGYGGNFFSTTFFAKDSFHITTKYVDNQNADGKQSFFNHSILHAIEKNGQFMAIFEYQ